MQQYCSLSGRWGHAHRKGCVLVQQKVAFCAVFFSVVEPEGLVAVTSIVLLLLFSHQSNRTIETCLDSFLDHESLDGDNQVKAFGKSTIISNIPGMGLIMKCLNVLW